MIDEYDNDDLKEISPNVEENNDDTINKKYKEKSIEKDIHIGLIKSQYGPKELKLLSELGSKAIILENEKGQKCVELRTIEFSGKRNMDWEKVEKSLIKYIDTSFIVNETQERIYIDKKFPDELKGSNDTRTLYGTNAKAKANCTQVIPYLIETAFNKRFQENFKTKHNIDAKYGWIRYTCKFNLPVFDNLGNIERFNEFRGELLVRCATDNKLYLYDIVNVKKA